MKQLEICSALALVLLCCLSACQSAQPAAQYSGKRLVWSDEFNYKGLPDSSKWAYDLGDGCPNVCGWGNNELQYYTVRTPGNARVENGNLVVEARKENTGNKRFSSARLVTRGHAAWRYGRVEARAKLPGGRGIWPAIWMLPSDWVYGDWPHSGEIDIMEFVGYLPDSLFGTVHTGRFNHVNGTHKSGQLFSATLSSDFHLYALEWDADKVTFEFDGKPYHTFYNQHTDAEAWPFDQAFYLILNVAVGGNWGGKMGVDESAFPQSMLVDYVRIYQTEPPATAKNK